MPKHTEGPWEVHIPKPGYYEANACSVIAPGAAPEQTVLVCQMNTRVRNPWGFPADTAATARLIAAAPELLAALEGCDDAFACWQCGTVPGRPEDILALITKVRDAITKAKGGE